jgi:DNA-binding NarL/FixJ family response regulator
VTALPPPPAELAHLSAHLTPEQLLALIEAYGGTSIHIPSRINQASPLARAIGIEAARALAAGMGGNRLKVPLARHWRVTILHEQGRSYSAIARALGITEDAVWRHLNAARRTSGAQQMDLFAPPHPRV